MVLASRFSSLKFFVVSAELALLEKTFLRRRKLVPFRKPEVLVQQLGHDEVGG